MKILTVWLFLCCLLASLYSCVFAAQEPEKQNNEKKIPYRVPKVDAQIKVDAILDEDFWQQAVKIEANIEVRPGENIPAPVRTEALLAYSDKFIFVAFIAYDPDPSQIRAHYCDRDKIWDDDWILILFDTFNDQRRTYDFSCNPLGIQADLMETPTGEGTEWDAIWESDGRITDEGYIVEMAIPFSSLTFPRTGGDQIWGFDAVRSYPRSVRHHIGAFPRDRNNNCYMCQAEKLIGFAGASPGRNVEFDPTFNAIYSQERQDETSGPFIDKDKKYEPGLTAQWGMTPNLTLSTTLNPDFSNIEADILQLDINNQFAIYYPEKRPFFLESADFFETPMQTVHTRTMANPNWGVKLTGKEGAHAIGYYTVQDNRTNYLFPGTEGSDSESVGEKAYGSVLRYKADIGKASNLGLLLTDREGTDYYNRVAGIDGDIKFTQKDRFMFQVLGSNTLYPDSISAEYEQPDSDFNGHAYYALYRHDTKHYELYGKHEDVDQHMRADLGFMTQSGYKYTEIGAEYKWRHAPGFWYTWISLYGSFDYRRDQNNQLLHKVWSSRLYYEGPFQSHAHLYGEVGKDQYEGREFNTKWTQGCFGLRPVAPLFVHLFWKYGDQIDYDNVRLGTCIQLRPSIELNMGLHLKIEIDHTFEKLDVDPGRLYTADISRLKLIYQFSKNMFLRAIWQYKDYRRNIDLYEEEEDPETRKLFSQFLFSYKLNPQTVFFLGYSDDYYGDHIIDFTQTNRTLFAKIGYAFVL